jgi:hypothetical protein
MPPNLPAKGKTIMSDESKIVSIVRDRQAAMRREMDRRQIAMKVIAQDSGIAYGTLLTYFPADPLKTPVQIPGSAIFALAGHLPTDLLSLLLPDGFQVVRAPEDINHDEIAEVMAEYLATKQQTHHPESPAGREIAECEDTVLRGKFVQVKRS